MARLYGRTEEVGSNPSAELCQVHAENQRGRFPPMFVPSLSWQTIVFQRMSSRKEMCFSCCSQVGIGRGKHMTWDRFCARPSTLVLR